MGKLSGRPGPDKGDPRAIDAGRKGGQTLKAKHGADYFKTLGRSGGRATSEKYGAGHFIENGARGGAAVRDAKGEGYYAAIGRIGGAARKGLVRALPHDELLAYLASREVPPTVAEMQAHFKVSMTTILARLVELEQAGKIRRERFKARAITLL